MAESKLVTVKTELLVDITAPEGIPFKMVCELPTVRPQSNIIWLTVVNTKAAFIFTTQIITDKGSKYFS